ncbi:hypothetical protein CAEBREN_13772 [Caenorhabditis brenneri]|uniref:Sdz-33 F-box domain-containing protein n=1 Tax=Caenorhabditis brenneri TaxID=135651 RepID=G0MCJ2_CAEBE|nr:hypothetical protein CAEBREN_13772 [Caenorhabditis brenneri]
MLLSILSKRTMTLIKWLKLELKHLTVDLQDKVYLSLKFNDNDEIVVYLDINGDSNDLEILTSDVIVVRLITAFEQQEDLYFDWKYPNVGHWIDHFHNIFSYQYVDLSFFELRTLRYSIESIVRTLEGIPIQILYVTNGYDVFRRVLHYFPTPRLLDIIDKELPGSHPAPCFEFMAKLLIQNFDALYFHSSIPFTLDSLLMMNSPFLWTLASKLSDRELNMYIRFWMNNPSSKLESLGLCYRSLYPDEHRPLRVFNKDVIFKGIDYIERPSDLKRDFQYSIDFHSYQGHCVCFYGGYDITRRDGTNCSISIDLEYSTFQMFVWP